MPDKRFFKKQESLSLKEIAEIGRAQISETADPACVVEDVAPLDAATAKDLSFLDNVKYREQFAVTKAGACFVSPEMASAAPANVNLLISDHPYKSYALAAQAFYPQQESDGHISKKADIHSEAKIGKGCSIDSGAVICKGVEIGDYSRIGANTVIGDNVVIGSRCWIESSATVTHALIGDYVRIYPGVRIGQDGFGFAIDPEGHVKVPQLGRVIIEDHVEIGANTTIDRGAGPDTVIGQGTWIDNLVQIGHNVRIGRGCVIVALVGIAGSAVIEDYVALGGQTGVAGHLTVGKGAKTAAQSGVMKDVPPGEVQGGSPAFPIKQRMKQVAMLNRLINKDK